ncbi:hypothetical protein [Ramlibacter algicola]|uniref:Uncharacterized protein n=1 Tax=Ramlibacter algicola TaxID=2795217 RepID=A0A934Q0D1_9BURK|nr:hypothetical protein [Ramlibacter algicola]MBK0392403.1 hypothetical protein [Ramlibacter algicola]
MTPFPTTENPPPAGARERAMADEALRPDEQAPLGAEPSYDDLLDVAVQYTFPASDPIAVDQCCTGHPEREEGAPKGPGTTPGHGNFIEL